VETNVAKRERIESLGCQVCRLRAQLWEVGEQQMPESNGQHGCRDQ
jgi:hypothetical protein